MSLREDLRRFVEKPQSSRLSSIFHFCVLLLIIISCTTVILQTLPQFHNTSLPWLEVVVTIVFTIELLLRFFVAESAVHFLTNPFNLLDLLAVLPGYFELAAPNLTLHTMLTLRILRIMWFIRILRFLRVARQCPSLALWNQLTHVFNSRALAVLAVLSFLIVVSASLLYLVESDRCEERGLPCNGFESIPASFWFSTITLTTVGYGDTYPFTALGRAIAAFLAVCAVILMSLATALLSVNFAETNEDSEQAMQDLKKAEKTLRSLKVSKSSCKIVKQCKTC